MDYFSVALKLSEVQKNKKEPNHFVEAIITKSMAVMYSRVADHQKAKEYYERALSIELNKLGPDHVEVARTYRSLGDVQRVLDAQ